MHDFKQSSRINFSFKTGSHAAQAGLELFNKAGFEFVILLPTHLLSAGKCHCPA